MPTNAPFICVADDFPVMSGAARRSLHARLLLPAQGSFPLAQLTGVFLGAWIHRSPVHSALGHRLPSFSCCICRCTHNLVLWVSVAQPRRGFSRLATCVLCRVQMWCLSPTFLLHDLFPSWVARALLFARDVYLRSGWPGPHVPGLCERQSKCALLCGGRKSACGCFSRVGHLRVLKDRYLIG